MRRLGTIGFGLFLLAATWCLRLPGLDRKTWNVDEAVTFTMAEQILRGEMPYRDAVDQRTPLAPLAQAAVFAAAGDWNLHAQHAAVTLMLGLAAVLLWRAAAALGESAAGAAGALWFILLCLLLPGVRDTMAAHTAWYLVFCSTLGFWALARGWRGGSAGWALLAGAAFGGSVLAKQPGVLDFGVALVLAGLALLVEPDRRRETARLLAGLLLGFGAALGLAAAWFMLRGAWPDFVYYTWTYNNTLYVPEVPRLQRWLMIRVPFQLAWQVHPLVVGFGGAAAAGLLVRACTRLRGASDRLDLPAWLVLGWTAAGLVSTTLSGRDFSHYSIQAIPGLSLACGWTVVRLARQVRSACVSRPWLRLPALSAAALLAVWVLQPVPARLRAFVMPAEDIDTIAALVRRHTATNDRIFVWGYNPEVYSQSERLPATRFVYCTFLTGLIPWTNLDPLRDTAYAIVPGAWDRFAADWAAHPPVLVADGRGQRGFFKYPIERQSRLWPLLERDYAEIETATTAPLGFWVFRRLSSAAPGPLPPAARPSGDVRLGPVSAEPGKAARVAVHAPAGTRSVGLYLDGRLYRRLEWPAAEVPPDLAFRVLAADRGAGPHLLQAVAEGPAGALASAVVTLADAAHPAAAGGPPLDFDGRPVAALESGTITGAPILPKKENPDHWDAHAPSRLVYPWLPGMNSLSFSYGIETAALERPVATGTDGVEVVVQVEDAAGRLSTLFRSYFDNELARRAGGRTTQHTPLPPLPPGGEGRLILQLTAGPRSDPAFDWSYWLWVRASRSPLTLQAGDRVLAPLRLDAPGAARQTEFNGRVITVLGATATVEFPATPDMQSVRGDFGLTDASWVGEGASGPVDFTVELVRPGGEAAAVFSRRLDPARVAADRGVLHFEAKLPPPPAGFLRLTTRAEGPSVRAEAFWGSLAAGTVDLSLPLGARRLPASERSRSDFGFAETVEDGRPCLFAHAESTLVYPWDEGLREVTGEFGLLHGAYTGANRTAGVIFAVEVEDAAGSRREIFRRQLDPSQQAADRGPQPLRVAVPPVPGGRVILRTLAPEGRRTNAWSYWRDLRGG